jgi:hypothetical protein
MTSSGEPSASVPRSPAPPNISTIELTGSGSDSDRRELTHQAAATRTATTGSKIRYLVIIAGPLARITAEVVSQVNAECGLETDIGHQSIAISKDFSRIFLQGHNDQLSILRAKGFAILTRSG